MNFSQGRTMKNSKTITAKSIKRPRMQIGEAKKQKLNGHVKQLITLLALQQAVTRNLQKEINIS